MISLNSNCHTKTCTLCKEEKSVDAFHRHRTSKDGRTSHCKPCRLKKARENPLKQRIRKKRWELRHPEKAHANERRYRLKRVYGIDLNDYDGMVSKQDGKCAICGNVPAKLVVDHCHGSNKVRGLLCSSCNSGLGYFKDNPAALMSAINYLALHKGMSQRFFRRQCDEVYAVFSEEMLNDGNSLEGFDLATLQSDLSSL